MTAVQQGHLDSTNEGISLHFTRLMSAELEIKPGFAGFQTPHILLAAFTHIRHHSESSTQ